MAFAPSADALRRLGHHGPGAPWRPALGEAAVIERAAVDVCARSLAGPMWIQRALSIRGRGQELVVELAAEAVGAEHMVATLPDAEPPLVLEQALRRKER